MLVKQVDGEVSHVKPLTIGIDAVNLRRGGGLTHLVELLRAAQPEQLGIARVVLWGGTLTLDAVEVRPWLEKRSSPALEKGLLQRTLWQRFRLSSEVRDSDCDVLFVPGGSYAGNFHPVVTMSRNMLPFEWCELKRYGWSVFTLKLWVLRLIQSRSYRKADGLIFLTNYARKGVLKITGALSAAKVTIPHGLDQRFKQAPRPQRDIADYGDANPYRVLYVSTIDQYKHQWNIVESIAALRREGFPIALDLVGPAYPPALMRLNETIDRLDFDRAWVHYHGAIPFNELHLSYAQADLGLFASSCENMPNILLETMASGLPIACSNRGPMPEVLGVGGVYFDPEQPTDITHALRKLITSTELREELSEISFRQAQQFSWQRCAEKTFEFLVSVAKIKDTRNV